MRFGVDDTKYINHILKALLEIDARNMQNISVETRKQLQHDFEETKKIIQSTLEYVNEEDK